MRAVSLHPDVIVATSRVLHANCTIVRGAFAGEELQPAGASAPSETFVIDSPILPDELELLPALVEQAGFAAPSGLLATHADWDHLLGGLAFPSAPLGCAESTVERLAAEPGAAQRELRSFDEGLYLERPRPLSLSAPQALPVPGRCEVGSQELELHPAAGHTADGMAIAIPWAAVLVAGDYLSTIEIPTIGGGCAEYLATLERLRGLVAGAEHVVPGHGPVIDRARALELIAQDEAYVSALAELGAGAQLPAGRRSAEQRRLHAENAARLSRS